MKKSQKYSTSFLNSLVEAKAPSALFMKHSHKISSTDKGFHHHHHHHQQQSAIADGGRKKFHRHQELASNDKDILSGENDADNNRNHQNQVCFNLALNKTWLLPSNKQIRRQLMMQQKSDDNGGETASTLNPVTTHFRDKSSILLGGSESQHHHHHQNYRSILRVTKNPHLAIEMHNIDINKTLNLRPGEVELRRREHLLEDDDAGSSDNEEMMLQVSEEELSDSLGSITIHHDPGVVVTRPSNKAILKESSGVYDSAKLVSASQHTPMAATSNVHGRRKKRGKRH